MRELSIELGQLYKKKDEYTIWNCVNVLLNETTEDPAKFKMLLLLSERIIQKQIDSVKIVPISDT